MKPSATPARGGHRPGRALSLFGASLLSLVLAAPVLAQARASGGVIDLRAEWTQFLGVAVAGQGDRQPRYGGRIDGFATVDGERLGLWKGVSFRFQGEFAYGLNTNRIGSLLLLPVNAALSVPAGGGDEADFSYSVVQRIGKARIEVGKINLLEASSSIPIAGGGGKEGFQHIGLASPPALLASPKIYGALFAAPAGPLILSAGLWSPDDWTQRYTPEGLFANGLNAMFVATLPATIGSERGFHSVSLFLTSRKSTVGERFPDLQPPPGLDGVEPPAAGGTHLKYSVQQYLWHDPAQPRRGFGFFGHLGVSTGTPGILDWSMTAGVSGSPPLGARPDDRFGVGYFRFSVARRVEAALADRLPVGDEQGGEIFYTAAAGPHLRLTAHAQLVDPVVTRAPLAAYVGLRAKASF